MAATLLFGLRTGVNVESIREGAGGGSLGPSGAAPGVKEGAGAVSVGLTISPAYFGWARDVFYNLTEDDIQKVAHYAAELAGVELPAALAQGGKVISLTEYRERRAQ